jgi:hypothetical protein
MRDYTETDAGVASNSDAALEGDANARDGKALRDEAEYASLTRRAATDNSRGLVDDVLRQIAQTETRERQRGAKPNASFRQAVEGFLGDLLAAKGRKGDAGWVYRSVAPSSFTGDVVSARNFKAVRFALIGLSLVEEAPAVQFCSGFEAGRVTKRWTTRFKGTPQLERLAAQHGVQPAEVSAHFAVFGPPEPLLRLKATATRVRGDKVSGKKMKIAITDKKVEAMAEMIRGLNRFFAQFDIRGGTHRGYYRLFQCGDHPQFDWNLGGRLYSVGEDSYQQIGGADRLKMTINGKPVCELDVRSSALTIFHGVHGRPLDFTSNPDPYTLRELSDTPREVVKRFVTVTFGLGQFPTRWPQNFAREYEATNGQRLSTVHPISRVRDAVARTYPLLAALRRDDARPPIWAKLEYLESEAVLGAMVALQAAGISSLSVYDSLIVQHGREQMARDILTELYKSTMGLRPRSSHATLLSTTD